VPYWLAQHSRHHAIRRLLHQFERKTSADAVTHEQELLDPQVVHQPELIVGECTPRILGSNWPRGLAAVRVALVKGRRTEIDFLNGFVVRKGAEIGIPTPRTPR
jgi:hypothetical protein